MFSYTTVCIGPETSQQDACKLFQTLKTAYEEQKSLAASVLWLWDASYFWQKKQNF